MAAEPVTDMMPDYLRSLESYIAAPSRIVLGLHSGTSADGPTVALVRVTGVTETASVELLAHHTYEYPAELRAVLLDVSDRQRATVDMVCQADMAVGEFFAEAALDLVQRSGHEMHEVALVASSGQIAYQVIPGQRTEHITALGREYMAMLDLGEASVIALRTGVITVSNLRRKDNAVGGFGAPLVPFGDWVNFRSDDVDRVIWNIGGICNATIVPAGQSFAAVWAFDAGPGNMLIDQLTFQITNGRLDYDANGELAAMGRVCEPLLHASMQNEFIRQAPPKAAARQVFGREFAAEFVRQGKELKLSDHDLVATATALTAETIAWAQRKFIATDRPDAEVIIAGGGARNPILMGMLRDRLYPMSVVSSESFGIPVDCREVLAMILIANETVHGRPTSCPAATGGSRSVVQGKIDLPV